MTSQSVHVPVMLREVLHALQLSEGLTVMDGTVGAAGHSARILQQIGPSGRLVGFDRDPMMLGFARQNLNVPNVSLIHSSYVHAKEELKRLDIDAVDRVLLDLGLSSDQLADRQRGFGFDAGGALDMRFDTSKGQPVSDLLNTCSQSEIESILADFGEEPLAAQIAQQICQRRSADPFETTQQLEDCVLSVLPARDGRNQKNPATRVFQALRIAANEELKHVSDMMTSVLPQIVQPGGIAVIITFHSLEDRIVKTAFKGQQPWKALTKKPIEATPAEIRLNPRSRSAKLRAAQRSPA